MDCHAALLLARNDKSDNVPNLIIILIYPSLSRICVPPPQGWEQKKRPVGAIFIITFIYLYPILFQSMYPYQDFLAVGRRAQPVLGVIHFAGVQYLILMTPMPMLHII